MKDTLHHILIYLMAFAMLGLFLYTVGMRFFYPYDLEWMEGGGLLHGYRVLHGQSLYPYPSEEFIPFIYPPLYYWALAAVAWCTELNYPAGRIISIIGALLTTGALIRALRVEQTSWAIACCGAALFLSSYEDTGAFLDIVRADGMLLALMTWSMVWVREGRIRLGALCLAMAFAAKHNAAIMGFPLALWLWRYKGWQVGLKFGLWSALPALLFVGVMQWSSQGLFLTYLLEVPAHHPFVLWRLTWLANYEIASALLIFSMLGLLLFGMKIYQTNSSLERVLGWLGLIMVAGLLLFSESLKGPLHMIPIEGVKPSMVAKNALGFILISLVLFLFGIGRRIRLSENQMFWFVCGVTAWVFSGIMRAHHGGFSNVLLPGMWSHALFCGLIAHVFWQKKGYGKTIVLCCLAGQLYLGSWTPSTLIPSQKDTAAGDRLIARLKKIDRPVFSPHSPWYPVMAGHPPSAHLIAIWDIDHQGGPFQSSVQSIELAIEQQKFGAILLSNSKVDYGRKKFYRKRESIRYESKSVFVPKKGWKVRPRYLYFPK